MLVNGCISVDGLKKIIDSPIEKSSIKTIENRGNLKRPSSDSTYGSDFNSDSEEGSEHNLDKPVRKRANLDHLSPEEKLMRRKLKNRVAAQNARDKKRMKMEEMEAELMRLKVNLLFFLVLLILKLFALFLLESCQGPGEQECRIGI